MFCKANQEQLLFSCVNLQQQAALGWLGPLLGQSTLFPGLCAVHVRAVTREQEHTCVNRRLWVRPPGRLTQGDLEEPEEPKRPRPALHQLSQEQTHISSLLPMNDDQPQPMTVGATGSEVGGQGSGSGVRTCQHSSETSLLTSVLHTL